MVAPVTPYVLLILQELEEKSTQMTCQDYGPLHSLVKIPTLTSYDVDLKAQFCIFVAVGWSLGFPVHMH